MVWDLILKSVFFSFILVFGLIGNVFVIFFFSFKMKKAPNFRWLVVHLAIADVIYAIVTPTQFLYLLYTNNEWRLGIAMCKVIPYVGPLTVNVSAWILCFMGYERYRAICYPFSPRLSFVAIHVSVFAVWIVCIILKIGIIWRSDVIDSKCIPNYETPAEYIINAVLSLIADSLIPMILLTYYLLRVNVTLRLRAKYLEDLRSNVPSIKIDNLQLFQAKKPELNGEVTNPIKQYQFTFDARKPQNVNRFRLSRASIACEKSPNNIFFDHGILPPKYYSANIEDLNICRPLSSKNQLRCQNHSINTLIATISRKRASLRELASIRIKEAGDRAIINVFSLTVIVFFLSSFPYNAFYFIVVLLHTSFFSEAEIQTHQRELLVANGWLGILVVSGCVMNVFIYSGKFPDFRHQMHAWLRRKYGRRGSLFPMSWKKIRN